MPSPEKKTTGGFPYSPPKIPGSYSGARPKDPSGLSQKPSQIRNRLRRAAKRAKKTGDDTDLRYELERYAEVGRIRPVEEWDLEELAHGRPRGPSGKFAGPIPSWITPDVTREAKKRLYNHAFGELGSNVDLAIKTIINLINSTDTDEKGKPIVDARTKLDAAKWIVEHVIGKPDRIITIDATDQARQMIASAIILDSGREDSHLAIEGEVVEDVELLADDE